VAWAEDYLHAKCYLDPSSRLAAIGMGRKLGSYAHFLERGSWVSIQHNVARAEAYLHAKFHLDPSNVTDRTGRTGQDRQRFDSIG